MARAAAFATVRAPPEQLDLVATTTQLFDGPSRNLRSGPARTGLVKAGPVLDPPVLSAHLRAPPFLAWTPSTSRFHRHSHHLARGSPRWIPSPRGARCSANSYHSVRAVAYQPMTDQALALDAGEPRPALRDQLTAWIRMASTSPCRSTLPAEVPDQRYFLPAFRRIRAPPCRIDRRRRPHHGHAVDVRRIETSGQHVDVDQGVLIRPALNSARTRSRSSLAVSPNTVATARSPSCPAYRRRAPRADPGGEPSTDRRACVCSTIPGRRLHQFVAVHRGPRPRRPRIRPRAHAGPTCPAVGRIPW